MLQNASYMFFFFKKLNKTKQLRKREKKSHPAGVESETFDV